MELYLFILFYSIKLLNFAPVNAAVEPFDIHIIPHNRRFRMNVSALGLSDLCNIKNFTNHRGRESTVKSTTLDRRLQQLWRRDRNVKETVRQ